MLFYIKIILILILILIIFLCIKNKFISEKLNNCKIENKIHFIISEDLQDLNNSDKWKINNSDYNINYHKVNEGEKYIKENFEDEDILEAYNCLSDSQLKKEFYIYCILFNEGGFYIDNNCKCLLNNCLYYLNTKLNPVYFINLNNNTIDTNFLGFYKKNYMLGNIINDLVNLIKDNDILSIEKFSILNYIQIKHSLKIIDGFYYYKKYKLCYNNNILNQNYKYLNIQPFNNNKNIPKVIYKTGPEKYNNLSENTLKIFENIIKKNPEYKIKYYDDDDCYKFIEDNFNEEVLWAFIQLKPGAYKSDLFRYCILYFNGGFYTDLYIEIDKINCNKNDKLILTIDRAVKPFDYPGVQISLIGCEPKLNIFKLCIDSIVHKCKYLIYGLNELDVTGPYLFKEILMKYLYNYRNYFIQIDGEKFKNITTGEIFGLNHRNLRKNLIVNNYYLDMWRRKDIYKYKFLKLNTLNIKNYYFNFFYYKEQFYNCNLSSIYFNNNKIQIGRILNLKLIPNIDKIKDIQGNMYNIQNINILDKIDNNYIDVISCLYEILEGEIISIFHPFNYNNKYVNGLKNNGFEDPRLFIFNESLYFIYTFRGFYNKISQHSLFITNYQTKESIQLKYKNSTLFEKNWGPFEYNNKLYILYSLKPFTILECNINTGLCNLILKEDRNLEHLNDKHIGLGSPPVKIEINNIKYLIIIAHIRINKPPIRKNFFILLEDKYPFNIIKISPLFSLIEDTNIEFITSLNILEETVEISCGIEDYYSCEITIDKQILINFILK